MQICTSSVWKLTTSCLVLYEFRLMVFLAYVLSPLFLLCLYISFSFASQLDLLMENLWVNFIVVGLFFVEVLGQGFFLLCPQPSHFNGSVGYGYFVPPPPRKWGWQHFNRGVSSGSNSTLFVHMALNIYWAIYNSLETLFFRSHQTLCFFYTKNRY